MMSFGHALVVDDDIHSRSLLSEWMREMDFDVSEAEDGREAIRRIRSSEYDIVISDFVMPGMDGVALIKEAEASKASVPFLVVTGYPSVAGAVDAMREGAADYLTKPFTPEEFTRRVYSMLRQKAVSDPAGTARGAIMAAALCIPLWAMILAALWHLL